MREILLIFLIGIVSCQNIIKEDSKIDILNCVNIDDFEIIQKDFKIVDLYNKLIDKSSTTISGYSGDYILMYDIKKREFTFFNSDNTRNVVSIQVKGFLGSHSSKDVFYRELSLYADSVYLPEEIISNVKDNIKQSIGLQETSYLINIITVNNMKLSDVQKIFGYILDGYIEFYNEFSNLVDKDKYPLRIRITPECYYDKKNIIPVPPVGSGM